MSQLKQLLPPTPRYFKANLHCHSTVTDGKLTPLELRDAYKAKGYSILAITDHDVIADHSELSHEDFLMLTGAEYAISEKDKPIRLGHGKVYHLTCIAKDPHLLWQPFRNAKLWPNALVHWEKAEVAHMNNAYDIDAVNAIIAKANEKGHLVIYNHPNWSLQEYPDYAGLKGLWGMEISNYKSVTGGFFDHDNGMVYRDLMNLTGRIYPLCTDDCHTTRNLGGGWIMVGAEKLEYGSVIRALEKGDFYASTGPEIHSLTIEGTKLRITCSDAREVALVGGTRYAARALPTHNDGLLREAEFDLSTWFETCQALPQYWLRVIVRGPYGHFATTRAYTVGDLRET